MQVNSINSFQTFQAKIKINRKQLKEAGTRTALTTGAAASLLMANEIHNMDWNAVECAPTVFTVPVVAGSGMLASAIHPDLLKDENENGKKMPS